MNPNNIQRRQFSTAGGLAAAGTAPVFGTEQAAAPSHSTFCLWRQVMPSSVDTGVWFVPVSLSGPFFPRVLLTRPLALI